MANIITAQRRGLKICTDTVERLKTQAGARAVKALAKNGADSAAYLEAKAEYDEIASTVARWKALVQGRASDLALAAQGE